MNANGHREIVIEYERIQKIRKACRTQILKCSECDRDADFITLREAVALFSTPADDLTRFMETHSCHQNYNGTGETHICVESFIECMRAKNGLMDVKLLTG